MWGMEGGGVVAAHTPSRLEQQALEKIVCLILRSSTPSPLQSITVSQLDDSVIYSSLDHCKLDKIVMTSRSNFPELLTEKLKLMAQLQQLKHWWDNNGWLGQQNSDIRRRIRECFTTKLELIDPHCKFPLFRFLLQLMFSTKAGGTADAAEFPDYPKIQLELHRIGCPEYSDVLRSLQPFGIEELSTQHIIFGDSQPWVIIIENSPFLKKVHFRYNISEETLLSVGKHCPLVETFIVEPVFGRLIVTVDCLYKTFFSGLDYEEVNAIIRGETPVNKEVALSFPKLTSMDMGDKSDFLKTVERQSLTEFLYNILYFYPDIRSVTCHTMQPFMPKLNRNLPEHCRDMQYNIRHIDLMGLKPFIQHYLSQNAINFEDVAECEKIRSYFKSVQHLTLCHCVNSDTNTAAHIEENVEFAKVWIPRLQCKILTIHVPFTHYQEVNNDDILLSYVSLLECIGRNLSALHFHLYVGVIDLSMICQLISLCPNLEAIGIRMLSEVSIVTSGDLCMSRLSQLTSLSVTCAALRGTAEINTFMEKVILASPNLTTLELVLAYGPCEWLMELAYTKVLKGIQTLRLGFNSRGVSQWSTDFALTHVGPSFYVPLIECLPELKILMLGILPVNVFLQVKSTYRNSLLRIIARGKPYVGYEVLHSMS